jgi:hypothetical protein
MVIDWEMLYGVLLYEPWIPDHVPFPLESSAWVRIQPLLHVTHGRVENPIVRAMLKKTSVGYTPQEFPVTGS